MDFDDDWEESERQPVHISLRRGDMDLIAEAIKEKTEELMMDLDTNSNLLKHLKHLFELFDRAV